IDRFIDVHIDSVSNSKKLWRSQSTDCWYKIINQNNICIDEHEKIVACKHLCLRKHITHKRNAEFAYPNLRNMFRTKFLRGLCGSCVIAKKDDFVFGVKERPAFYCIPLGYINMRICKRFG